MNLLDKGTPGQEAQEASGFEKPSLPEAEAAPGLLARRAGGADRHEAELDGAAEDRVTSLAAANAGGDADVAYL